MKPKHIQARRLWLSGITMVWGAAAFASSASSVTVHTSSEFIYAANQAAENVSGYRIDLKDGRLSALAGSPYRSGRYPVSISMSSDGRFVYVALGEDGRKRVIEPQG